MPNYLFQTEINSTNVYVKYEQICRVIDKIRQIWQNQIFSNDILYSFHTLRESLDYYKKQKRFLVAEITKLEQNVILFGGPAV